MVIEHEAGDLTCTVEASTPLAELQSQVGADGQMLALDPPGQAALTVGEVFDRALFGPRAHRYGLPRDLVLGVRVRLAGGNLIRGGGKVVKNVAGYDLPKLFTGAEGRLGELLELTLRLHPLPDSTCTVVTEPCDPRPLEQLAPACVEYAWPDGGMLVRFESPAAAGLAAAARELVGGELVADDAELWDAHRRRQAGLELHRCPPTDAASHCERLRAAGATTIVGRWARGWLFADVPADRRPLSPLEQRVIERFAS
ncbi:MAG: glycolate oxidase binding subunit [Gaiellales bacterium]|jgi:glycolate oxidase FAD binding subunit|nr:glycolate oxidase binding subunit [Gaiellales bacterium]